MHQIQMIRSKPWGRNMPIVIIIEGNLNMVAMRSIANYMESNIDVRYHPVECMRTAMKGNGIVEPFVWVDGHDAKERLQMFFNGLLTSSGVFISEDFISSGGSDGERAIKDALEAQLRNMRVTSRVVGKDGFERVHMTVTGKGGGQQDDLAMDIMLGAFWGAIHEMWIALNRRPNMLSTINAPDTVLRHRDCIARVRDRMGRPGVFR